MPWVALCVATLAGSWLYKGHAFTGPVVCPLRLVFGLPCPGCGLTRGLSELWHGDISGALAYNAFALPVFAVLWLLPVLLVVDAVRGPLPTLRRAFFSRRLAYALGVLLAAYHVGRIIVWAKTGTLWSDYFAPSFLGTCFRFIAGH